MAASTTFNPKRKKLDKQSQPVITTEPPAKRQKSETPTTNGRSTGRPTQSRDGSRNGHRLLSRASTPTNPPRTDEHLPALPKQTKSPWKNRSPYALQRHEDRENQYPTSNSRTSSSNEKELSRKPPTSVIQKLAGAASRLQSSAGVLSTIFPPLPDAKPIRFGSTSSNQQPPNGATPQSQALSIEVSSRAKVPETVSKTVSSLQHSRKPLQPRIEVVISSQELLEKFSGPIPKSQSTINDERRAMLKDLKKGPGIAQKRPEDARRLFGDTFSKTFAPESDEERMKHLASRKGRKISRNSIQLKCDTLTESFNKLNLDKEPIIHPAQAVREVLTNRFNEQISPPITFANDVNERRLPGKFQFVDHYVLREGVKLAPTSRSGCRCTDCRVNTCTCFSKVIEDREDRTTHVEQHRTYTRRHDGLVVLSEDYIAQELDKDADHFEITECNEFCRCDNNCLNRVVGKGRTVPLEIFQTEKCGFGVRSSQDIVRGQFIDTYLGEILTETELCQREDAGEEGEPSYIHSLDWFDYNSDKNYHVDGKNFGTPMRFVNHSCNPNARSFVVQMHKEDKKVYHLAFFAIRDIPAGTEIRIDYSGGADEGGKLNADLADGFTRCFCGEKNCRKRLWRPGVKTRRRRRLAD